MKGTRLNNRHWSNWRSHALGNVQLWSKSSWIRGVDRRDGQPRSAVIPQRLWAVCQSRPVATVRSLAQFTAACNGWQSGTTLWQRSRRNTTETTCFVYESLLDATRPECPRARRHCLDPTAIASSRAQHCVTQGTGRLSQEAVTFWRRRQISRD